MLHFYMVGYIVNLIPWETDLAQTLYAQTVKIITRKASQATTCNRSMGVFVQCKYEYVPYQPPRNQTFLWFSEKRASETQARLVLICCTGWIDRSVEVSVLWLNTIKTKGI